MNFFVYILIFLMIRLSSSSAKVKEEQYVLMPVLFHFDDYDRCMLYNKRANYCLITFQLHPISPKNISEIWNIIHNVSSDQYNYRHDILRHGVCIMETLGENFSNNISEIRYKLEEFYRRKYRHMEIWGKLTRIICETKDSPYTTDVYDVLFIGIVISYTTFVFVASIYEGLARYKSREEYEIITETVVGKFLLAFSLFRNWYRLKSVNLKNPDVQALRSIQGIRFYNMIIVIFGHTFAMNLAVPVSNPMYTETMREQYNFMFLGMGKYVIQTYLMISSWLLAYHFFVTLEKEKEIKLFYLIFGLIHRYIRLTPTLAFMIAFHSTWLVHLSRGPFWDQLVGKEYRLCRQNWWSNLLYINNYINAKEMCFPQTWYVTVDTQLYILGLILVWFMWKFQNKIVYILGGVFVFHTIIMFSVIYWNNWEFSTLLTPEVYYNRQIMELDQWHITYASTYSNLPGLVAGLNFGYLFYRYRNQKLFTNKISVLMWWITVWSLTLGVIVLPNLVSDKTRLFTALFGSLDKSIFVFGIGLGIFGVTQGQGWMIKWICEWPPTYILGRLTYSTYLIHIFFQRFYVGTRRSPNYLANHIIVKYSL